MLADRCQGVFKEFFVGEVESRESEVDEAKLITAFEEGTITAGVPYQRQQAVRPLAESMGWLARKTFTPAEIMLSEPPGSRAADALRQHRRERARRHCQSELR